MHISKVTYSQIFPLSSYLNERIGVEIEMHNGEDEEAALALAKKVCEDFHKKNAPAAAAKEPTTKDQYLVEKDRLLKVIQNCTDLDALYNLEKPAKEYHIWQEWRNQELLITKQNKKQ